MATLRETLERCFAAVAFADAADHGEAMRMAGVTPAPACAGRLEDVFAAVAFAEADCRDAALEMMGCVRPARRVIRNSFLADVGLGDVAVCYGVAPI
ncbi:hypothetical protein ACR4XJ_07135 [Nitratidesulfovibrio sp. D1]|uniref:hypothetical protein n=1 Tax=Nitratidesulfovibrio sp. D1 TaxID=3440151 RepID=UPI003EBA5CE7